MFEESDIIQTAKIRKAPPPGGRQDFHGGSIEEMRYDNSWLKKRRHFSKVPPHGVSAAGRWQARLARK